MVNEIYRGALKAEKELEHLAKSTIDNSQQDPAEEAFNETRRLAERAIGETLKATEGWGKTAFEKGISKTEEILW